MACHTFLIPHAPHVIDSFSCRTLPQKASFLVTTLSVAATIYKKLDMVSSDMNQTDIWFVVHNIKSIWTFVLIYINKVGSRTIILPMFYYC